MTRQKQLDTQELNAYFTPNTFIIDNPENQPDDTRKPWTQSFYHDNRLCMVVSNEIKATFKQLEESGYVAEKNFRLHVIGFAKAAINLYGVISQDDFVALYNGTNERQTQIRSSH